MQVNCPSCSQRILIDDAKVPDRPFKVKCPRCQTSVSLPGRGAAPAAAPEPPAPPPAAADDEEMRSREMAQLRREMSLGEVAPGSAGRAIVSLPDRAQAAALTECLTRSGFQVDNLEDADEGGRLVEQGIYDLVATSRAATPGARGETLFQRLSRLSPDNRRRVFVVLVGNEYKTGDGTQAWASLADLVLNARDVPSADPILRSTLTERSRLYQVYLDARRRYEQAAG